MRSAFSSFLHASRYLKARLLTRIRRVRRYSQEGAVGSTKSDGLLRIEFHNQLLGDIDDDLLAHRELMNQDPAAVSEDLHPARHLAFVVSLTVNDVRGLVLHLLSEVDDIMRTDPIEGNVDLLAIDQEVAVHHKLAGLAGGYRASPAR